MPTQLLSLNTLACALASLAVLACLPRVLRSSLGHPESFPFAAWGWQDILYTGCYAGFYVMMAFVSLAHPEERLGRSAIVSGFVLYTAMVILLIGFICLRGINPITAFGLNWRAWRVGVFVTVPVALLLALPVVNLVQLMMAMVVGEHSPPQPIVTFLLENRGWEDRLILTALVAIGAPVTEELVFRGCIYGIVRKYAGRTTAIIGTSMLFAFIHGHLPSIPGLFVLAVAFSLVYERTGSLWAPIGVHALFNTTTVVMSICFPDSQP